MDKVGELFALVQMLLVGLGVWSYVQAAIIITIIISMTALVLRVAGGKG